MRAEGKVDGPRTGIQTGNFSNHSYFRSTSLVSCGYMMLEFYEKRVLNHVINVNDVLELVWNEVLVACCEVLFQHLSEGLKLNHGILTAARDSNPGPTK
jgi:hypothetical protein